MSNTRETASATAADTASGAPSSSAPCGIMQRLRERTSGIHAETERLPLMAALLDPGVTPADYARYLAALHGVYASVEPALYAALSPTVVTRLGVRPKLPALQRDIAALGLSPCLPPSARPPRAVVDGEAAVLGGLYVLEGATLGGRVIATRLQRTLGPEMGLPLSFLNFHGAEAGAAWRRFSAAMTDLCLQARAQDDAVAAGAVAVFEAVHRALREAGAGAQG
jgi:heme oxygenase